MSPVVLHIVRPYQSEDEYLAAEAWTIDARGMLLVGEAEIATDTAVVFDVTLANGSKVIRAEGRASGYLAASEERAGGLRVRFKRYGAQTKAFIDRAVHAREEQLAKTASEPPPAPPADVVTAAQAPAPLTNVEPIVASESVTQNSDVKNSVLERSGIHRRLAAPVTAPPNREELLERLRERASKRVPVAEADHATTRSSKSS
ncbi:MAG: hypothetical protein ACOY0T_04565 [Myxococcota bacterium]